MIARQAYNEAGVVAMLTPGQGISISAAKTAVVPITGVNTVGAEQYAGQSISYISVPGGRIKVVRVPVAVR
jgi:hypothetical protein